MKQRSSWVWVFSLYYVPLKQAYHHIIGNNLVLKSVSMINDLELHDQILWSWWPAVLFMIMFQIVLLANHRVSVDNNQARRDTWWRHQKETFSALLVLYAGNSRVTGEFHAQRPQTWSFDVFMICAWINGWVNNREAGDRRRYLAHYDVSSMMITDCSFDWFIRPIPTCTIVRELPGVEEESLNLLLIYDTRYNLNAWQLPNFELFLMEIFRNPDLRWSRCTDRWNFELSTIISVLEAMRFSMISESQTRMSSIKSSIFKDAWLLFDASEVVHNWQPSTCIWNWSPCFLIKWPEGIM